MGRLYDRFKWKAMIFINLAAGAGAFILVPLFGKSTTTIWPLFIATAYCGIVENQSLTFVQSSLLEHYRDDVAPALAVFRMLWALGIAAGFLVQLGLNYVQMSILEACVLAVSATVVVIYELREDKRTANS
jgi:predicted MFS family arabinose efflux permease